MIKRLVDPFFYRDVSNTRCYPDKERKLLTRTQTQIYLSFSVKDVDECKDSTICGVGGNCTNTIGSYNCSCDEGFIGGGDATPCKGITTKTPF